MDLEVIKATIRNCVGQTVRLSFGDCSETVFLAAADPDGILCQTQTDPAPESDFWIGYQDVAAVAQLPLQA